MDDWRLIARTSKPSADRISIGPRYPQNLVLISHAKSTVMTDGKAQLAPELPRGLGYGLAAKADVIGYTTASKEDGEYNISFEAYDERVVGSRLRPLAQKVLPLSYDAITKEILSYKEEE